MDREFIGKLLEAVKAVQMATNQELQLHQLSLLLMIADAGREPVSFGELGNRTMLSRAAISRNMQMLGRHKKKVSGEWTDTGYGLINIVPYPYDTRAYAAELSGRGRALMNQLKTIMAG